MKRSLLRCLTLFLAVALTAGLLSAPVLAGPSEEQIDYAYVFVSYPIAGEHPNLAGLPELEEDPFTVDEVHFFELDAEGHPGGKFLTEEYTFKANEEYACEVYVKPNPGYVFSALTEGAINNHAADAELLSDGTLLLSCFLTCAPGYVTVTFDPNGSPDPAPAPLRVPMGGTVWDALRNFELVRMPDQLYEQFWDWSLSPFGSSDGGVYFFTNTVWSDLTLYAMWEPCEKTVDLWVSLPDTCLVAEQHGPEIRVPDDADYSVSSEEFFIGLVDGHLHEDLVYCDPLQKGQTYYSQAYVYLDLAGELPGVKLHGADLISVTRDSPYRMTVLYSVTIPAGDTLKNARAWINTPKANTGGFPQIINLTPGVSMNVQGWYDNADATVEHEGVLEAGKTYYAKIGVYDGTGSYTIQAKSLNFTIEGQNAKLVKLVDTSATGAPNSAGAIVSVTIPKYYEFAVSTVPSTCGRVMADRYRSLGWVTEYDFLDPEGTVTITAKPAPGYQLLYWYDDHQKKTLSHEETITLELNRDINLVAYFVEGTPFADVSPKDYFFWPVKWATERQPAITKGTDATHFSPYLSCTRAQVMTFLWAAKNKPEPVAAVSPFSDVSSDNYYFKPVLWAVENKITSGMGDGSFGADMTCTRAQVMTFLWAAEGKPAPKSSVNPFTDVSPGDYYYKAVLWAVENGVTKGTAANTFGPNDPCTRGQVITFLYKLYGPVG